MSRGFVIALLVALAVPANARAEPWRWPVHGDIVGLFHLPARSYGPGGHRGIDIAAPAGTPVLAACPGRVTFAGTVPGAGHVVSVACGELSATYLELGAIAVRRGTRLRPGDRVGTVGPSRRLRLGARRRAERLGYVDPLSLLGAAGSRPPVAPPPVATRRRPPPAAAPPKATRAAPGPRPSAPLVAWVGAAFIALAVPGLGVRHAVRRRRRRSVASTAA